MNKREKIALGLAIAGIIWWFAENFYFGWHLHAMSPLEGVADFITWAFWVLAFFIRPTRIEKHYTEINTKNVEIIKPDVTLNKKDLSNEL